MQSNNTAFMDDVEQFYQQYEQLLSYSNLSAKEQANLDDLRNHMDFLYDSAQSREELSKVRWGQISENAEDMVGEIESAVGLPDNFDPDRVSNPNMNEQVQTISYNVERIIESLQIIEENAEELSQING